MRLPQYFYSTLRILELANFVKPVCPKAMNPNPRLGVSRYPSQPPRLHLLLAVTGPSRVRGTV